MANKLKIKLKSDKISDFILKLEDLTGISDSIKLKIDSDNILIYSILGNGNVMIASKNYLLNTDDYMDIESTDLNIDIIILNAKKFVKNLNFIKSSDKILMEIVYKESTDDDNSIYARSIQISSGKFKVNWLAGEHYEIKDINKKMLKQRLDLKNKKWSFNINKSDFLDIKKLSSINSEKIININILKGNVILSETSSWELEIDKIEERDEKLIINKRFLSSIDSNSENIEFNVFENFILIKNEDSNLILSFEQDFNEE